LTLSSVGRPVKAILKRIRAWREAGWEVRLITARACDPDCLPEVRKWLKRRKLTDMPITNRVDRYCVEIWDDRAIQVERNTGNPVRSLSMHTRPMAPLLEEAFPNENRPKLKAPADTP
jgi:hypothetical protein